VVINMVGKFHETKHIVPTRRVTGELSRVNFSYEDTNVTFPRQLAKLAKEAGVETFVHVSSLGASPDSASAFNRSKYRGELAVREEFPNAIIIRPGTLFGSEDKFLNPIAKSIVQFEKFFLLNQGQNLVQPTYVADVSEAIMQVIRRYEEFEGKTIHLAGPSEYTYKEIVEFVADIINVNVDLYDTPPHLALLAGHVLNQLPFPTFTADTMARITEDTYIKEADAGKLLTFSNLGMEPSSMDRLAFNYLYGYRPGGHFTETQGYH
jgi:NADH dehydrogenase (ubiquinone) 1 alpha subcomplex subunit 9